MYKAGRMRLGRERTLKETGINSRGSLPLSISMTKRGLWHQKERRFFSQRTMSMPAVLFLLNKSLRLQHLLNRRPLAYAYLRVRKRKKLLATVKGIQVYLRVLRSCSLKVPLEN